MNKYTLNTYQCYLHIRQDMLHSVRSEQSHKGRLKHIRLTHIRAVSEEIGDNKKAVSFRQTHKQIPRIKINKRKWQVNK